MEEPSALVLALKWFHTFYVADHPYGFGWWVNKMLRSKSRQSRLPLSTTFTAVKASGNVPAVPRSMTQSPKVSKQIVS